jgi:hypothetical protein
MIRNRNKVLGLAMAGVLGLVVMGASSAQALTKGIFLLDGKAPVNGTLTASLEAPKHAFMSFVGANNIPVQVECEALELTETVLNEKDFKVSAKFIKKCEVLEPAGCTVAEPIIAKALGLVLRHKAAGGVEEPYVVLEPPTEGAAFTGLKFSGCILPEEVEIKGLAVFKDCELFLIEDRETHLLTEVPHGLKLALDEGLKFGTKEAELLGSSLWKDPGHTWAAH